MNIEQDLIAAIATAPGRGGIGVVRLSGDDQSIQDVAQALLGKCPQARYAEFVSFLNDDGEILDEGLALYFPAPHSFTGETVLELQGHGGPVVMDMLLKRVLSLGARLAQPGEFTQRAFLNDKLDLAQAEAIADLIDASSEQAARFAMRSLAGEFSKQIHHLVTQVIQLRMYVEAAIDFPEEEIDFLSDGHIEKQLNAILGQLENIKAAAQQGAIVREGMTVVIAGKPNVGKSTLLNCLSGRETAIVTNVPGTTRDMMREHIHIDGLPLHIIDTAGLRHSDDVVEQEGIRRAKEAMAKADRVLLLLDDQEENDHKAFALPEGVPLTFIHNKIDRHNIKPKIEQRDDKTAIYLSAKTGEGVELLIAHLIDRMAYQSQSEGGFLARCRHLDALAHAEAALYEGHTQLKDHQAGELLAEDLRQAQQALSTITGEFTTEDLLGKIFSDFCIGK